MLLTYYSSNLKHTKVQFTGGIECSLYVLLLKLKTNFDITYILSYFLQVLYINIILVLKVSDNRLQRN